MFQITSAHMRIELQTLGKFPYVANVGYNESLHKHVVLITTSPLLSCFTSNRINWSLTLPILD